MFFDEELKQELRGELETEFYGGAIRGEIIETIPLAFSGSGIPKLMAGLAAFEGQVK